MPQCTNCYEYYFGNPDSCPKCHYNFSLKRVVTGEEERELRRKEQEQRNKLIEEKQKEEERIQREKDAIEREKLNGIIKRNSIYEYKAVSIWDNSDGSVETSSLNSVISSYAEQGWRIHTIFTDEIGHTSNSNSFGGITNGTNATIDQIIIIFERCIREKGELFD